ncbi:DUF2264 domain-containing protein [Lapidilactobacillus luobeiensis]|uniref:DUF2264 domain-containing protein n=1 Tax=Lapidilactobacillus luobeiensis TaxID=2950371 RepID=UPI0021C35855|nr:DUF2264 domain-containing protein [Lapidilactobacillus luobeiensis]
MLRQHWLITLDKIVGPVFTSLSHDKLKSSLPHQFHKSRQNYQTLEAVGRSFCGIAPWLELSEKEITTNEEQELHHKYQQLVADGLAHAVDPNSADFCNFTEDGQPLVDAAFLAHGIIRSPKYCHQYLTAQTKSNLISALKSTRKTIPPNMNWNLFSAMIEAALYVLGGNYDLLRVIYAIRLLDDWYKGDGTYGDGPIFHCDYYNSFVIQPMAIDLLTLFSPNNIELQHYQQEFIPRFQRYATIQERMINMDGSFPIIGRSITYRSGVFQALAQAALEQQLPQMIKPAQIRDALSAVIDRTINSSPRTFDSDGWLLPGVYGEQPSLAEEYISIGSLYLCTTIFLPLGLPAKNAFWTDESCPWTAQKIWQGSNEVKADQSIS